MVDPTLHQSFQGLPRLSAPFVDENGLLAKAWYRFVISCWRALGQAYVAPEASVVLQITETGTVNVIRASTGAILGQLNFSAAPGGAAEVQVVGASPFVFTATNGGTLLISSGQTELSRDGGGTFYVVSLVGNALPMLKNDVARVSWFGNAPSIVFLPVSG